MEVVRELLTSPSRRYVGESNLRHVDEGECKGMNVGDVSDPESGLSEVDDLFGPVGQVIWARSRHLRTSL